MTGDIAFSGHANEYAQASEFFDSLLAATALTKECLYIVPGNHDVDREAGKWLVRTLHSAQDADDYFSQTGTLSHIEQKMNAYANWYDAYFNGVKSFARDSPCNLIEVADIGDFRLAVLSINTSVFSQDDADNGKLWVGRRPLDDAIVQARATDSNLKVVLMHHPLDWLNEVERVNITSAIRREFDCVLTGHLHQTDVEDILGTTGACLHLAAGATYQGSEWPNRALYVSISGDQLSVFPIRYEDSPQEVWTVDPSLFPNAPGYEGTFTIHSLVESKTEALTSPGEAFRPAPALGSPHALQAHSSVEEDEARRELLRDLFLTPSGEVLYAEPRIMNIPQEQYFDKNVTLESITLTELLHGESSYFIEAHSEYGGTTLCRRLHADLLRSEGTNVFFRDARGLPNYRKKLKSEFPIQDGTRAILILDNFDQNRDERLLRELKSLDLFDKYLIVSPIRGMESGSLSGLSSDFADFTYAYLWSLSRQDIRAMTAQFFDSRDSDFISTVVDKIYSDLLALCIPLTPSNVIMYLKVLHREDDFYPINRVDIVERYVAESLRRAGDVYQGAFNSRSKMDVVSSFVYKLFSESRGYFSEKEWFSFCSDYSAEALIEFDARSLLGDLLSSRLLVQTLLGYRLKYGFFYAFFLGRHIAARTSLLEKFLASGDCGRVSGVVEVISGLSSDNAVLVEDLCSSLEQYLERFFARYVKRSFDPFINAEWVDSESEEEKVWTPITKEIEAGPKKPAEIDTLKQSLMSEARTSDQEVKFQELVDLEYDLFMTADLLKDAIKNSDNLAGDVKKRTITALFTARLIVVQIGAILSPVIAQKRWVRWGGVGFLNHAPVLDEDPEKLRRAVLWILEEMSRLVAKQAADEFGTRNLGQVFKAVDGLEDTVGFLRYVNFCCMLRAKPANWQQSLAKVIEDTDRKAFYLASMLDSLVEEYTLEVNQGRDRQSLKELIALIRTKRSVRSNAPGSRVVSKMLAHLEKIGHFDSFKDRGGDEKGEESG